MKKPALRLSLLSLLIVGACQAGDSAGPATVESISVSSSTTTLPYGQTVQLSVLLRGRDGKALSGRTVDWSSSNPSVATVSSTGVVTAGIVRGGSAETVSITATCDGQSASTSISVQPIAVSTIDFSLSRATIFVGQSASATLTLKDPLGGVLTGRTVNWSSSVSTVASVSATGAVTGIAPGQSVITATAEGKSATVSVAVLAVPVSSVRITSPSLVLALGQSQQLTAVALDADGNLLPDRLVSWSSSQSGVMSVSSTGIAKAISNGDVVITATVEGKSVSATATAGPQVSRIQVTPNGGTIYYGRNELQLAGVVLDAQGQPITGRTISWTTSAPDIAAVSTSGLVGPMGEGTATITASNGGKTATVSVVVLEPVAAVYVEPPILDLPVDGTKQYRAVLVDRNSKLLLGRTIRWRVFPEGIAKVDESSGLVTALRVGTTSVFADAEWSNGAGILNVLPAVKTVVITPNGGEVTVRKFLQLTAVGLDANGKEVPGRKVNWTSGPSGNATVSTTGLVEGMNPGSTTVTAMIDDKSASVNVMVNADVVGTYTLKTLNDIPIPGITFSDSRYTITTSGGAASLRADGTFSFGVAARGTNRVGGATYDESSSGSGTYKVVGNTVVFTIIPRPGDNLTGLGVATISGNRLTVAFSYRDASGESGGGIAVGER